MRITMMGLLLATAACNTPPADPPAATPAATPAPRVTVRVTEPAPAAAPASGDSINVEVGPDGVSLEAKKKAK
jgi:hypothetical protein